MKKAFKLSILGIGLVALAAMAFAGVGLTMRQSNDIVLADPGDGTVTNPFVIPDRATLDTVLRANATIANRHFRLTDHIDLSGSPWLPVVALSAGSVFDGDGFEIRGLNANWGVAGQQGFFNRINGATVKNVTFTDVNIVSSNGTRSIGTLAGEIGGTSHIENVIMASGSIMTTNAGSSEVGGFFGNLGGMSGNVTIVDSWNNLDVTGALFTGGFFGIINATASAATTLTMTRVLNTGTITAPNMNSNGAVGGFVGLSWQTNHTLNIDWAINRGTILRGSNPTTLDATGGIIGLNAGGTVNITNTVNDSDFGYMPGHSGTRLHFGIVSVRAGTITMNNTHFNNTRGATQRRQGDYTGAFPAMNQALIDTINNNRTNDNATFILDTDGGITLTQFRASIRFSFICDQTSAEVYRIQRPYNETTLVIPTVADIPTRTGFVFEGWRIDGTNTLYTPGETHNIDSNLSSRVFTMSFRLATFRVLFEDGALSLPTPIGPLSLGESLDLTAGAWGVNNRWLLRSVAGGYEVLGDTNPVSTLVNTAFLTAHGFLDNPPGYDGTIFVRTIDTAQSATITVEGPAGIPLDAGVLNLAFSLDGVTPIVQSIQMGVTLNIPVVDVVNSVILGYGAIPNEHYQWVTIEFFDKEGNPIASINGMTINALSQLPGQGVIIRVDFAPLEYNFQTIARFRHADGTVTTDTSFDGIISASSIYVDQPANASVSAMDQGGFRIVRWLLRTSVSGEYVEKSFLENDFTFNSPSISAEFLSRHLIGASVYLVAEFYETVTINISVEAGQEGHGELDIIIWDRFLGPGEVFGALSSVEVVFGSHISIQAHPHRFFSFDQFTNVASSEIDTQNERLAFFQVNADRSIQAQFASRQFNIRFEAIDPNGMPVAGISNLFTAHGLGNTPMTEIAFGDELVGASDALTARHRLIGFFLLDSAENFVQLGTHIADENFILRNLDITDNFIIFARVAHQVSIVVTVEGNGNFSIGDGAPITSNEYTRYIDAGSTVTINALAEANFQLMHINGFLGAWDGEVQGTTMTITNIRAQVRNITIRFEVRTYAFTGDRDDNITVSDPVTPRNEYITLTVNVPNGRRITRWTLNGQNISNVAGVDVSGSTATFRFDNAWYNVHGTRLDSDVRFGMATPILLAIILPSILIPLLAVAVAFYVISSKKKYAAIKAELVAEQRQKVQFGNDFIKDLREGKNVGQVTDADVKKAMKDKKKTN